jgi:phage terminase large subunit-like protein
MVRMANGELEAIEAVERPDNEQFEQMIMSWDCSFKETEGSDYVAGGVWGCKGADRFLLDQVRDRMDCPRTMKAIRMMSMKWPRAQAKLIEGKANGPAVIQMRDALEIRLVLYSKVYPHLLSANLR